MTVQELDEHVDCGLDCINIRTNQMFNILESVYVHKHFSLPMAIHADFEYKKEMLNQNKKISKQVYSKLLSEFNKWTPYYLSLLKK